MTNICIEDEDFQNGVDLFASSYTMVSVCADVLEVVLSSANLSNEDFDAIERAKELVNDIVVVDEEDEPLQV